MTRAICDRCGFEYELADLRKEWTGLMVCDEDWDKRPDALRKPNLRPEGVPLRNARPEQPPIFADELPPFDPASLPGFTQ